LIVSSQSPDSPPDDVPEADWSEQELDADPLTEQAGEPGARNPAAQRGLKEVDEADLAEQETLAYGESDEPVP
jgi:hypothetical protein